MLLRLLLLSAVTAAVAPAEYIVVH